MLAVLQGEHERAVRICGAAAALREEIGAPRPEADQALLEERLRGAAEALGEEACEAARADGRALGLERAIAEALREG